MDKPIRRAASQREPDEKRNLPTLYRDPAFWGMTSTQFLGAFNDNLFKQIMLLLSLKAGGWDLQGPAMIVFALPFILCSGYAGYLSDRFAKRPIIILSKAAEIVVMALGLIGFLYFDTFGLIGLMTVLLLMALQSTFFGPGKYGILPEMLRKRDLPRANGWIVMTTFLAIIFGTACAGLLTDPYIAPDFLRVEVGDKLEEAPPDFVQRLTTEPVIAEAKGILSRTVDTKALVLRNQRGELLLTASPALAPQFDRWINGKVVVTGLLSRTGEKLTLAAASVTPAEQIGDIAPELWRGSAVCIFIAILGTFTSLLVRHTPPASPNAKFSWSTTFIPPDSRRLLAVDRQLLLALLASCVFWMVAGLTQQAVNSLGKVQLVLSDTSTSIMAAIIGLGIAVGAVLGGWLSGGRVNFRVAKIGAWGSCFFLLLLGLPGPHHDHLLGFAGSLPALALMGVCAGFFAIPIQTFIQSRPPSDQKGRIIGVQNTMNFTAILLSGVIYIGFDQLVTALAWPRATIFLFTAALMLPVAIFYRPRSGDI
jgi:MFS family permease